MRITQLARFCLFVLSWTVLSSLAHAADTSIQQSTTVPSAVMDVIREWVRYQNEGEFSLYSNLYAAEFQGVRRSGNRATTLDYSQWLDDRKRMFASPIRISIYGIRTLPRSTPDQTEVEFTQLFRMKGYADVGPKRMVLRSNTSGRFEILREEMLSSTKVAMPSSIFKTHKLLQGWGLVLTEKVPSTWKSGAAMEGKQENEVESIPEPNTPIPPAFRGLIGKNVHLYSLGGGRCEHQVGDLVLVHHASYSESGEPTDQVDIKRQGTHVLLSRLKDISNCAYKMQYKDYFMAEVLETGKSPLMNERVRLDPVQERKEAEPYRVALGKAFGGKVSEWPKSNRDVCQFSVSVFHTTQGAKQLFATDGCHENWGLFEMSSPPRLIRQGSGVKVPPQWMIDLDQNGSPDFIFIDKNTPGEYRVLLQMEPTPQFVNDLFDLFPGPKLLRGQEEETGC